MRPPIPSPFGEIEKAPPANKGDRIANGASVSFRFSILCLPRKNLKEMVTEPISVGVVIIISTILTAILSPVFRPGTLSFLELWILFLFGFPALAYFLMLPFFLFEVRRARTVILTPYGVSRWSGNKETELSWPAFLFIFLWLGDVIFSTFASSIFIPREAFASRQEACEFVQIARTSQNSRRGLAR